MVDVLVHTGVGLFDAEPRSRLERDFFVLGVEFVLEFFKQLLLDAFLVLAQIVAVGGVHIEMLEVFPDLDVAAIRLVNGGGFTSVQREFGELVLHEGLRGIRAKVR